MIPSLGADGIPWCTEACPSHDGKRCELLGGQPSRVCEPMVLKLVERVARFDDLGRRGTEAFEEHAEQVGLAGPKPFLAGARAAFKAGYRYGTAARP